MIPHIEKIQQLDEELTQKRSIIKDVADEVQHIKEMNAEDKAKIKV